MRSLDKIFSCFVVEYIPLFCEEKLACLPQDGMHTVDNKAFNEDEDEGWKPRPYLEKYGMEFTWSLEFFSLHYIHF